MLAAKTRVEGFFDLHVVARKPRANTNKARLHVGHSKVSVDPEALDLSGFASALAKADVDIISTSCGFMIYFQNALSQLTEKTFISSALVSLPKLRSSLQDAEIMVITFDADVLAAPAYRLALGGSSGSKVNGESSPYIILYNH